MKQQETVRVPLHSVIDLITNSSTEIFVYSENSVEPAKELINEILKLQGIDKKCEDLFDIRVTVDEYQVEQAIEYGYEFDDEEREGLLENLSEHVEAINTGNKPDWWEKAKWDVETNLEIIPKDPKYNNLAKLMGQFLYSTEHEEHSWG